MTTATATLQDLLARVPADRRDLAILGLEAYFYAQIDDELPDDIKSAWYAAAYERGRMSAPDQPPRDDDPTVTLIDSGAKSGIKVARYDQHERGEQPHSWLDFTAGRLLFSVDIQGGAPGIEVIIGGSEINARIADYWTLDSLRQLCSDLDRLLRDERLLGALAEQG